MKTLLTHAQRWWTHRRRAADVIVLGTLAVLALVSGLTTPPLTTHLSVPSGTVLR